MNSQTGHQTGHQGQPGALLSPEGYAALFTLARELLPAGLHPSSPVPLRVAPPDAGWLAQERYDTLRTTREAWRALADALAGQMAPAYASDTSEEEDSAAVVILMACAYYLQDRALYAVEERRQERLSHESEG